MASRRTPPVAVLHASQCITRRSGSSRFRVLDNAERMLNNSASGQRERERERERETAVDFNSINFGADQVEASGEKLARPLRPV